MVTPYPIFMAKGLTFEEFKTSILKRSGGISASNLYQFAIKSPDKPGPGEGYSLAKHFLENLNTGTTAVGVETANLVNYQLNMLCNEIQIPGVTMSASDVKMPQKGMIQKVASAKVFNELDVSFYCDADSLPFKYFRCWQDYIIGAIETPREMYSRENIMISQRQKAYAQRYYDHYTCDIVIDKLEKVGKKDLEYLNPDNLSRDPETGVRTGGKERRDIRSGFKILLAKAYPYTVSSIPYSTGASNIVKVTVGFYYEYSHLIND